MFASRVGRLLVILLALVVGVLVGAAAMKHRLSGRHGVQPGSVVLKVAPPESAAGNDMDAAWLRAIRTHAELLQSDAVLQQVLLDQGDRPPVPGASRSEKVQAFRKMLSVRVVPGTALIEVRASDADPVPHKSAAEALADAYIERLKGLARKDDDRKIQLLRNLKDLYWNQLRELEDRERKMHADLTVKGMTGTGRFSVLESQRQILVQQYVDAGRKAAETRDQLDSVVQQLAQNVDLPQIEQTIEQDVRLREMTSRIDQLDIRRDVELLTVPATDPTIARTDREREALLRKIRETRDENRARATVRLTDQLRL